MNFNGEIYYNADLIFSGSVVIIGDLKVMGRVLLANGTSSQPSLAFQSNPAVGLWFDGFDVNVVGATSFGAPNLSIPGTGTFGGDVVAGQGTFDNVHSNGDITTNSEYTFGAESGLGMRREAAGILGFIANSNSQLTITDTATTSLNPLTVPSSGPGLNFAADLTGGFNYETLTPAIETTKSFRVNPNLYVVGNAAVGGDVLVGGVLNGAVSAGTRPISGGAGAFSSVTSTGTGSFAGVTSTAAIVAGTNPITGGAATFSSLTSNGTVTAGTNSITGGTLFGSTLSTTAGTNPFVMSMTAGSTTSGVSMCQWLNPSAVPTSLYGIGVAKTGAGVLMLGMNKNAATGDAPANCAYVSTGGTGAALSIGLGSSNLPDQGNVLINTNGSVSFSRQPLASWTLASTQTISSVGPPFITSTITTWNTTAQTSRGNSGSVPTMSSGTVTVPVAGNYLIDLTICFSAGGTGRRLFYINKVGDTQPYGVQDVGGTADATQVEYFSTSAKVIFTAGQTFNISVAQTSGSNMNLISPATFLTLEKIS